MSYITTIKCCKKLRNAKVGESVVIDLQLMSESEAEKIDLAYVSEEVVELFNNKFIVEDFVRVKPWATRQAQLRRVTKAGE